MFTLSQACRTTILIFITAIPQIAAAQLGTSDQVNSPPSQTGNLATEYRDFSTSDTTVAAIADLQDGRKAKLKTDGKTVVFYDNQDHPLGYIDITKGPDDPFRANGISYAPGADTMSFLPNQETLNRYNSDPAHLNQAELLRTIQVPSSQDLKPMPTFGIPSSAGTETAPLTLVLQDFTPSFLDPSVKQIGLKGPFLFIPGIVNLSSEINDPPLLSIHIVKGEGRLKTWGSAVEENPVDVDSNGFLDKLFGFFSGPPKTCFIHPDSLGMAPIAFYPSDHFNTDYEIAVSYPGLRETDWLYYHFNANKLDTDELKRSLEASVASFTQKSDLSYQTTINSVKRTFDTEGQRQVTSSNSGVSVYYSYVESSESPAMPIFTHVLSQEESVEPVTCKADSRFPKISGNDETAELDDSSPFESDNFSQGQTIPWAKDQHHLFFYKEIENNGRGVSYHFYRVSVEDGIFDGELLTTKKGYDILQNRFRLISSIHLIFVPSLEKMTFYEMSGAAETEIVKIFDHSTLVN